MNRRHLLLFLVALPTASCGRSPAEKDGSAPTPRNEAVELTPAEKEAKKGVVLLNKGDFDTANSHFSEAIKLDPKFALAYFNRGVCHQKKDKLYEALNDYGKAIELDPNLTDSYVNRGNIFGSMGMHPAAIRDYTAAIELDPENGLAYYNRGVRYEAIRQLDKAKADFEKAKSLGVDPEAGE